MTSTIGARALLPMSTSFALCRERDLGSSERHRTEVQRAASACRATSLNPTDVYHSRVRAIFGTLITGTIFLVEAAIRAISALTHQIESLRLRGRQRPASVALRSGSMKAAHDLLVPAHHRHCQSSLTVHVFRIEVRA